MILDQIEEDLAPFLAINQRASLNGSLSPSDRQAVSVVAKRIARKHVDFFVSFYVTCLHELNPQLEASEADGSYSFKFRSLDDAANAAEMAICQVIDESLAETVCTLILMKFLQKSHRAVDITTEESHALIRTIARISYSYRLGLVSEFTQEGKAFLLRDTIRRWIGPLLVAGIALLWAAWFVLD